MDQKKKKKEEEQKKKESIFQKKLKEDLGQRGYLLGYDFHRGLKD